MVVGETGTKHGVRHQPVVSISGWVGKVPSTPFDNSPAGVAHRKHAELVSLSYACKDDSLVMTPDTRSGFSLGWPGGVALDGIGVAVSGWPGVHDKLLALVILYNVLYGDLRLHHVGCRFAERSSFDAENDLFAGMYADGLVRPAADHERVYFQIGKCYREHQFFPSGPKDGARHWDLVCPDPHGLLRFIAGAYGEEPTLWDVGPNDPVGVVWVKAKDGKVLGVMARSTWWEV